EVVSPDLGQLVAGALPDPGCEGPVLLRAPGLAHPAVRDVADEDVLETVGAIARDGRPLLGKDELPVQEPVEEPRDVQIGRERLERAAPEDATDERRALQD